MQTSNGLQNIVSTLVGEAMAIVDFDGAKATTSSSNIIYQCSSPRLKLQGKTGIEMTKYRHPQVPQCARTHLYLMDTSDSNCWSG